MIEDDRHWHSVGGAETEYEAARNATFHNAHFLADRYDVDLKDALIFLTLAGRLSLSRTSVGWNAKAVVCASFAKAEATAAFANYRRC